VWPRGDTVLAKFNPFGAALRLYFIAASLLLCIPANAQVHEGGTGTALLRECEAATTPVKSGDTYQTLQAGLCLGLVRGVMGTMKLWGTGLKFGATEKIDLHGCIPDAVEDSEAVAVVLKYLKDNPNKLHLADYLLVNKALVDGFPCKT